MPPMPSHIYIPAHEVGTLLFGQQHLYTEQFFRERLGQGHTVYVEHFPHFQMLNGWLGNAASSENPYLRYLKTSWRYYYQGHRNTKRKRLQRAQRFMATYEHLKAQWDADPITVCRRLDGHFVIIDGNHRAAIALKIGRGLIAHELCIKKHIAAIATRPNERYGAGQVNMPYQTLYLKGQGVVCGRRPDVRERMNKLACESIRGRTVLDLGCNLGMSCLLSIENGAKMATGIDASTSLITSAVRLNALFGYPCRFIRHDLSMDISVGVFDTILCFGLFAHISDRARVIRLIERSLQRTLYFEGHANTCREDYADLLGGSRFSRIQLLGYGRDGIHNSATSRPLWRCDI